MRPCPRTGLCGAEGQALGPASSESAVTVWYWPFLCSTWRVPAPPWQESCLQGDLPGLRCHQTDSVLTGQAPLAC